MKRRQFIRCGVLGFGALHALGAAHAAGAGNAAVRGLVNPYDLAVVRGGDFGAAAAKAIEGLGGMTRFVRAGDVVLLKPNVSFPNPPEWGSTTHPDVILAVTRLCLEAGAKRVVALDFPMSRAERCFENSGMRALAENTTGLSFFELGKDSHFEIVPAPQANQFSDISVARLLGKSDVFINLPAAKAHSATTVSFGLKNLMGLIQHREPFHTGHDLHLAIAELATVIRPALTILDAGYALMTNGPQGPGRSERLNTIVAGTDPVAVDAYGCTLGEWNNRTISAENVKHIQAAAALGVGKLVVPAGTAFHYDLG